MQPVRLYDAAGLPLLSTNGALNTTGGGGGGDASAANQLIQIALEDVGYKGNDITSTTGATEAFTIPSGSTLAIISASKDAEGYININAAATNPSPLFVNEFHQIKIRLKGVTSLNAYVLTGTIGVVFYG